MVGMAAEKTVVELIGLVENGGEELGGFVDASEAGEEGDELVLDEGFGREAVFDDRGESLEDFFRMRAELKEQKGRVGEEGRR